MADTPRTAGTAGAGGSTDRAFGGRASQAGAVEPAGGGGNAGLVILTYDGACAQ
ncbi:hypothetical protein [Corallococcus terminator]|uniref:hypothetical protein n=1 Tax=Corallococcus terminator TaxID=2316733 RepID=UPI0013150CA1|nr:hypothetical protein [Corallococcus terminator]